MLDSFIISMGIFYKSNAINVTKDDNIHSMFITENCIQTHTFINNGQHNNDGKAHYNIVVDFCFFASKQEEEYRRNGITAFTFFVVNSKNEFHLRLITQCRHKIVVMRKTVKRKNKQKRP